MSTSTRNPTALCDHCHQRPKYSTHSYCGKTCAAQAAALCNHCHLKPKYTNYDFCGKNCAALANAKKPSNGPAPGPAVFGNINGNAPAQQSQGMAPQKANNGPSKKQQQKPPAPTPVQFTQAQPPTQVAYAPPAPQPPPPQSQIPPMLPNLLPSNNPFLQALGPQGPAQPYANTNTKAATGPLANPISNTIAQAYLSVAPLTEPEECLIPGCGLPVHTDATGARTSEYCSMRHREEAVAQGLVEPCIMCLTLPQSDTDHFCSRICREEALTKQQDE